MTAFTFTHQTGYYKGKVREVYSIGDDLLAMIASDRLSAFDVILPKTIPFKGQVLNEIAAYMLRQCNDICNNWLLETPVPNASIGKKCTPFAIEMVVRGNITGHAWRTYKNGDRILCGVPLPEGMKENDFFDTPIITPSTKAHEGHDEDISKEVIIQQGLATEAEWALLEQYALALFERGKALAAKQGLILADTKYEFGKIGDTIYLMDEIHTPDSSRYFYADGFHERLANNKKQKQLSKEFVREWLIENNFMGKEGQVIPEMNDEKVNSISQRYIELYEQITGEVFIPTPIDDQTLFNTIEQALTKYM
ncbi:phosphoribosylaminoimidazolesuccinocarboxamide synthase [Ferruginibacter yonginensis]|uniref:Phosphoribosylaminoimidazole-succinocarboxamide synthase n=1 Tax=Ferruginibacter yonginensis TaxID=1310416 RepID=A0ABV8QPV1_9BACT